MDTKEKAQLVGTYRRRPVYVTTSGTVITYNDAGHRLDFEDTRELATAFATWLTRRGVKVDRYA